MQFLKILKKSMNYLWPPTCIVCGLTILPSARLSEFSIVDLCGYCYQILPWLKNACYQCGGLFIPNSFDAVRCEQCYDLPPAFDRFCGLFHHRQPISRLISQLKFFRKLENATILGKLLNSKLSTWYPICVDFPEAIIPMPLHDKRLRWRGFNQVVEILKPLKNNNNLNITTNLIARVRYNKPQVKLKKHQRQHNLKNSFKVLKPIKYKHVAIVDDVFTTGSTVSAVSVQLRFAGVERIDIWCISRA